MNNDTDEFLSPTCIFVWTLNENQNLGHKGNAKIEKKIGQGHERLQSKTILQIAPTYKIFYYLLNLMKIS